MRPKISELEALLEQQKAEMDALVARQAAEMAALATRRKAALDAMQAVQAQQLKLLKETQRKELDDMRAAQNAELGAIKAARAAALGVVESAIQRELEDERIAAQLKIDLRKAGGDQEKIDAAHARAATSTERLLERDELDDLMKKAEERVRARYKSELDTINDHWDEVEAVTTARHQAEQTALEVKHAGQMAELEESHALELAEHNRHWDELEALLTLYHAVELAAMEKAHKEQLEALLASLKEQRKVLEKFHAVELLALQLSHAAQLVEIESYWDKAKTAHEEGIAAINALPDPTPPSAPTFSYSGIPQSQQQYRQHGGPVSAGVRYRVGERGPEDFIPSQSGRIDPNVSSGGGGVDAKALGAGRR